MSDLEALVRWYGILTLIAVALLPFVAWLGARLGPARYGLLRPVSLVGLTAVVWWPAVVVGLPFSRWTLLVALVVLGGTGWAIWLRGGIEFAGWRALLAFEALWLATFLVYAWFRSYQPDIINTEKPMEIALLSSVSRSSNVPAPDPWFAGSAINYYYFGYQTFATVIKLAGVPAAIGFNLALATLFASVATVAAAAGTTLVRALGLPRRAIVAGAGLASVFVLLAGNLETARRFVKNPDATVDAGWWDGVGWQASRIIYDSGVHQPNDLRQTINEFPAFSFVLGDLHPHVLTLPLLAVVLVLAVGIALSGSRETWPRLACIGALVGLLYASNSWDAPAGMLLVAGALAISNHFDWRAFARDVLIVATGALVMAAPFIFQFDAPIGVDNSSVPAWLTDIPVLGRLFNTFAIVNWRPSSVRELLVVHGAWLLVFVGFATTELYRDRSFVACIRARPQLWIAGAILAFGVAMAWAPAVILLGAPLVVAAYLTSHAGERVVRALAGLFAAGFLLALIPEFIYIQDVFADRMNTVFKLFYQSWLMLGVASAGALIYVIARGPRASRLPASAAAGLLIIVTLLYTPLSAQDWTNDFAQRRGLDGSAYIARSAPDDLAAIDWVARHAADGDTIVELPGCAYVNVAGVPFDRVSAFSGVPTIVGWLNHEFQWRRGEFPAINDVLDARAIQAKSTLDGRVSPSETEARFVILGRQELHLSPECDQTTDRGVGAADALRAAGWQVAFQRGDMTIFARPDDPVVADLR